MPAKGARSAICEHGRRAHKCADCEAENFRAELAAERPKPPDDTLSAPDTVTNSVPSPSESVPTSSKTKTPPKQNPEIVKAPATEDNKKQDAAAKRESDLQESLKKAEKQIAALKEENRASQMEVSEAHREIGTLKEELRNKNTGAMKEDNRAIQMEAQREIRTLKEELRTKNTEIAEMKKTGIAETQIELEKQKASLEQKAAIRLKRDITKVVQKEDARMQQAFQRIQVLEGLLHEEQSDQGSQKTASRHMNEVPSPSSSDPSCRLLNDPELQRKLGDLTMFVSAIKEHSDNHATMAVGGRA